MLAALVCGACAGSGDGLDENGRPIDESPGEPDDSDFTRIQQTVFTPICTRCHQGATAPLGLRLDAGNSYAMLVGVASVQVPSLLRVEPGVPDASYLVRKIQGTASVGGAMPLGGPPLPQAAVDLIRAWIAGGAQPPPAPTGAAFVLASSVPADGETALAPVGGLTLVFSAPVDAAVAGAGTIVLEAATGAAAPGGMSDWRQLPLPAVTVSLANPAVVSVATADALAAGRYRLRLRGDGPTALADVDARVLDGDGDGRPGGDRVILFEIGETPGSGPGR